MRKIIYKVQMLYENNKVAPVKAIDLLDACLICMSSYYTFSIKQNKRFEAFVLFGSDVIFAVHAEDTPEMMLVNFLNLVQKSLENED